MLNILKAALQKTLAFHPLIELKLYLNFRLFLYYMLNRFCFLPSCLSFSSIIFMVTFYVSLNVIGPHNLLGGMALSE